MEARDLSVVTLPESMLLRADQAIELLSMFVDGTKQTCRGGLTMSVHGCRAEMDQPLASNLDFSAHVPSVNGAPRHDSNV